MEFVVNSGKLVKYLASGEEYSVRVPEGVTAIGDRAFARSNVREVIIPKGVTSIGMSAFEQCKELTCIELPATVRYIGREAFGGCVSLAAVNIPCRTARLNDRCFHGCRSLTEVTLHEEIVFGAGVFDGCMNICSLNIGDVSIRSPMLGVESHCFERLVRSVRYRTLPARGSMLLPSINIQLIAELYFHAQLKEAGQYLRRNAVTGFELLVQAGRDDLLIKLAAENDIISRDLEQLIEKAITCEKHEVYIILTGIRHSSCEDLGDRFAL